MNASIQNRNSIIEALYKELVGPAPAGRPLEKLVFSEKEDAYGPFFDEETGEEILQRDVPTKRYGVAVLHPFGTRDDDEPKQADVMGLDGSDETSQKETPGPSVDAGFAKVSRLTSDSNPDDLDLTLANSYKPSSIGISFLAEFPLESRLIVEASGGRYEKLEVYVAGNARTWWRRKSIAIYAEFTAADILNSKSKKILPTTSTSKNLEDLNVIIELYTHSFQTGVPFQKLLSVCLVNRTKISAVENTIFQAHFKLSVVAPDGDKHILPYPGPELRSLDDEEKSMALLYRHNHTFGIGHGCAAMWDYTSRENKVGWLSAECLPAVETPSITPDISDENGNELKVPMALLAGLIEGDNGFDLLYKLVMSYEYWISEKEKELQTLDSVLLRETGERHLEECRSCAKRMKKGLDFLKSNELAFQAFQLANRAILLQQLHSHPMARRWSLDEKNKRQVFSEPYIKPDPLKANSRKGYWRAFQIAFLLANVESVANAESDERDIVELIWFPTGGGKTEAYLGLAAFSLLLRRLRNTNDDGVQVLMRYTLRLLTTQQFLRASRLICALEQIRRENSQKLGTKEFSIGLWVGGHNTPNTRNEALTIHKALEKGDKHVENKFLLDRCPWCSAQIGLLDEEQSKKGKIHVIGYYRTGNSVVFRCPDKSCEFSSGLPIYVTDEEIYDNPPSMIIGTVDKFAMLTWKPDARALFGLDNNGNRIKTPPGLIIQDELHLISGPLGSMVGLHEVLIEELCTDRRSERVVKPKIISSTATIRRYREQIKALYAREQVCLFPPPGLDVGDSFFSKYATDQDGNLKPGRVYVGVHAPGLGSMQTVQVRTFTALLQSPMDLPEAERDPWWTLLLFFNSLRELGTTLSLLQSDIPDYQQVYINRLPNERKDWRIFSEIVELTGRASSEDVPKAITALEKSYPGQNQNKPIDVCLASNILEVGVDIERLSLMAVVGQPKTTSQYIQVTGRVGRNWAERPGLVVTLYSVSKPRDRSHFEKFVSYHQKLYSQVEPTSVTPFSAPVLERALHALMIAYVRQKGDENRTQRPDPYPENLLEQLRQLIIPRIQSVDPEEVETFEKVFNKRAKQWKTTQPIFWEAEPGNTDDIPLMRVAGTFFEQTNDHLPLSTMQSMRTVDAECVAEIRLPTMEGESEDA